MSLTSLLKEPEFSKEFSRHITFPETPSFPIKVPRQVEPEGAARMGTALDYAIRFVLERRYPKMAKHVNKLQAELALLVKAELTAGDRRTIEQTIAGALDAIRNAQGADSTFAWGCYQLANLDIIPRSGKRPKYIPFPTTDALLGELRRLLLAAVTVWPAPERYCILNPTFGMASQLTGGADADVVQDGCIIDIKCVNKISSNEAIKQLVGYYILSTIDDIDGLPHGETIDSVAVYYARHQQFVRYPIHGLIDKNSVEALQELFETLDVGVAGDFPGPNYSSYYDGSTSDWEEASTSQGRRVENLLQNLIGDEPEDHDPLGFPG